MKYINDRGCYGKSLPRLLLQSRYRGCCYKVVTTVVVTVVTAVVVTRSLPRLLLQSRYRGFCYKVVTTVVVTKSLPRLLQSRYRGCCYKVVTAVVLPGEFKKHAIWWQLSSGCQMAGFLALLSSELSVFTLSVITLERHYAIMHAMYLNKRLSLRQAGKSILTLTPTFLPLFTTYRLILFTMIV